MLSTVKAGKRCQRRIQPSSRGSRRMIPTQTSAPKPYPGGGRKLRRCLNDSVLIHGRRLTEPRLLALWGTIRHGGLSFRPADDEGRPALQAHDDNVPSAGRDRVEHSRPVAVTAPDSFNERRVRWSIDKGDQHAKPLLRSRRATPPQGNTQGSGVQCDRVATIPVKNRCMGIHRASVR